MKRLLVALLFPLPALALSPEAKEFMAITAKLEPVQCEKRQLRRQMAMAQAEQRDEDLKKLRARFVAIDRNRETARLEKRLDELRKPHSSTARAARAIRKTSRRSVSSSGRRSTAANEKNRVCPYFLNQLFQMRRAGSITSEAVSPTPMPAASAAAPCRCTPSTSAASPEQPLREQRAEESRQHVAHAGGGHAGIAGGVDEPVPVARRHHAAVALEHHVHVELLRQALRGDQAVALHLRGLQAEQPRRLPPDAA